MKSLSHSQVKLLEKFKRELDNDELAELLVRYKDYEAKTSFAEIRVIAYVASYFKQLTFSTDSINNKKLTHVYGQYKNGEYIIVFDLQYKIQKPKGAPYSVDVLLKMLDNKDRSHEFIKIALEYDGDDSHYKESGIKKSYKRDLYVLAETGISTIRLSPEMVKEDPELGDLVKNLKKIFTRKIDDSIKEFHYHNRKQALITSANILSTKMNKAQTNTSARFIQCHICEGQGYMGNDYCQPCKGMTVLLKEDVHLYNIDDYLLYPCPDCINVFNYNLKARCIMCSGAGEISRDKAIEIARKRNEN